MHNSELTLAAQTRCISGMKRNNSAKKDYTIKQFNQQFPDDDACLLFLFEQQNPGGGTCICGKSGCFHRVKKLKKFACAWCGSQLSPTAGTIFHKSSTPLRTWFHAMFLMMASRNGVSAMELMRQTGVCYRTAWRMNHQIRKLMKDEFKLLSGTVEADETYVGGKRPGRRGRGAGGKVPIAGVIERGGNVVATAVQDCKAVTLVPNIVENVEKSSIVCTDELGSYNKLSALGFKHSTVNHAGGEYVRGSVHTNSIESFWAQFKRSFHGTFHHLSPQHLQKYLDEFCFRNNHRREDAPMFQTLVARASD
jgi:transposase-like protein